MPPDGFLTAPPRFRSVVPYCRTNTVPLKRGIECHPEAAGSLMTIIALDDAARTLALVRDRWLAAGEYRRGIDGALHGFNRNRGGVVVSSSEDRRIRFQCAPSSTLSKQLEEMGFKPVSVGPVSR